MMHTRYIIIVIISAVTITGIVASTSFLQRSDLKESQLQSSQTSDGIMITNGIKHIVPLDQIKSGGPPKDGIPSIDNPKFVGSSEASFVSDDDLVIGLRLNGETRAYPLFIMVWHEIVNDKLGNTPVAVTYCPLCFTTQVFERRINGIETEFGTSGKLYNSNLVMYDRNTDSQWSQALGKAITGDLASYELKRIPFDVVRWPDWKSLYPDTKVLTTDTSHIRPYGSDPYGDYYTDSRIIFPVENDDDRMHPKEIILGFDEGNNYKAYKLADLESNKIINDKLDDREILLLSLFPSMARAYDRTFEDQVLEFEFSDNKIIDKQTGSVWNIDGLAISGQLQGKQLSRVVFNPGFWFEWVAFHPQTEIYQG